MKRKEAIALPVLIIGLSILACNFPGLAGPQPDLAATETIVALASQIARTMEAPGIAPTQAVPPGETSTPEATATPTLTAAPTDTPTITPTETPSIPIARLSQNTNCRSGPGTVYDIEHIALAGEELTIVARSSVPDYVIVEIPNRPGQSCWLWTQYAEISGDTSGLPVLTPPPTPTPPPTETPALAFSISRVDISLCSGKEYLEIEVKNTGPVTIESFSYQAKDLDTSTTVSAQGNAFKGNTGCLALVQPSIAPGGKAYVGVGPFSGVGGHTVRVTMTGCALDGQGQPCAQRTSNFDIPSPSDRSLKEGFAPVDAGAILEGVVELPIQSWTYIEDEGAARHIGPMAQDFHQTFGLGGDDRYIIAIDADGVALASIQALKSISDSQADQISALESRLTALEAQGMRVTSTNLALMASGFALGAGAVAGLWAYSERRRRRAE